MDSNTSDKQNIFRNKGAIGGIFFALFSCLTITMVAILATTFAVYKFISNQSAIQIHETLTKEFHDYTEKITRVANLELATRTTNEMVKNTVKRSYKFPLKKDPIEGSASVIIRCPVTYTYFVDMKGEWSLLLKDDILYIQAPRLQAGPPAIDTSRLERKTNNGWLVFGEEKMLKDLERDLSSELSKKAVDKSHMEIVLENCRKSLEEFIGAWVVQGKYKVNAIKIKFKDEPKASLIERKFDHGIENEKIHH